MATNTNHWTFSPDGNAWGFAPGGNEVEVEPGPERHTVTVTLYDSGRPMGSAGFHTTIDAHCKGNTPRQAFDVVRSTPGSSVGNRCNICQLEFTSPWELMDHADTEECRQARERSRLQRDT